MMADADNNIWIHPNHPDADPQGTIWQVFDRSGKLVYRVRVPSGMTILAFGSGGVAYIAGRDAGTSFLQKVRIR
jgi:sugar lactone lactonase YvrE